MKHQDLTSSYDYERLLEEEKKEYLTTEITEDLKLGGIHDRKSWHYYWSRVAEDLRQWDFGSVAEYLTRQRAPERGRIEVLSLGSGWCGPELDLARRLPAPYRITCTDVNADLFEKARGVAREEGLALQFEEADLNFIKLEEGRYDLVFAHAVLHHVINLEHLFSEVTKCLKESGVFHMVEVVGEDRHLLSKTTAEFANVVLRLVPNEIAADKELTVAGEEGGMEGVRQSMILPLVDRLFVPVFELRHGAFMRFVCHHPVLGLLDPDSPAERQWLDFLIDVDRASVARGLLAPTEVWGVYRPKRGRDDQE